jgi:hypothetical protein
MRQRKAFFSYSNSDVCILLLLVVVVLIACALMQYRFPCLGFISRVVSSLCHPTVSLLYDKMGCDETQPRIADEALDRCRNHVRYSIHISSSRDLQVVALDVDLPYPYRFARGPFARVKTRPIEIYPNLFRYKNTHKTASSNPTTPK